MTPGALEPGDEVTEGGAIGAIGRVRMSSENSGLAQTGNGVNDIDLHDLVIEVLD